MQKLLLVCSLFLLFFSLQAQPGTVDYQKNLETAVKQYNDLRSYTSSLDSKTITDNDLVNIADRVKTGTAILDDIVANGPSKLTLVARYFRANFYYEKGFLLGMKGRRKESAELLQSLESDMGSFNSAAFPLEYYLEDKRYVIKWDNFGPTQGEYYTSMAEFARDKKDNANVIAYAAKANGTGKLSNFLTVLCNNWLVEAKTNQGVVDRDKLDAALKVMEAYHGLDEKDRQSNPEFYQKLPGRMAEVIQEVLKANPSWSNSGYVYAQAGNYYKVENLNEQYLKFALAAVQAGYKDRTFLYDVAGDAANAGDRVLAKLAADQFAEGVASSDCDGLAKNADLYERIGEKSAATRYRNKADDCTAARRRAERRAGRDNGLYFGAYVIPMFSKDWGGVVTIQTRKMLFEGSYLLISNKKDRSLDVANYDTDNYEAVWDGYYTHLGIYGKTKSAKKGNRPYTGLLFGYNVRNFAPIENLIVADNGNLTFSTASFKPVETRYILMSNTGAHYYSKFWAADIYFGFGASYNQFKRGNESFEVDKGDFTFNNDMLDNRKEARFSFMMRLGLTVGFQLGNNNRR